MNSRCTKSRIEVIRLMSLVVMISLIKLIIFGSDSQETHINLSGLPRPYVFGSNCALASGDTWFVSQGKIYHYSPILDTSSDQISNDLLNAVYFSDVNHGWVAGDNGIVMHTSDGGKTWIKPDIPDLNHQLRAIYSIGNQNIWVVGHFGTILHSLNEGKSWKKIQLKSNFDFYSVYFIDSLRGWIAGSNGAIFSTKNGGKTWVYSKVKLFTDAKWAGSTSSTITDIKFVNRTTGWVSGFGGIGKTTDGGKTWKVKPIDYEDFIGLVFRNELTGWAISSNGKNFCTIDGGEKWQACK